MAIKISEEEIAEIDRIFVKYDGDIELLKYVLHLLKISRSKRHVSARLEGLLRLRLRRQEDIKQILT